LSIVLYIILLALSGLVVGALARLALPGRDPLTIFQTIAVGLAGSFLAGLVYALIFRRQGGGIVVSATIIVYIIRRSRGGTLTRPAPERDDVGYRERR
jgi:uncharacterized membrane protein YeaQ/YmgE (transglycosylase-associated protein family)